MENELSLEEKDFRREAYDILAAIKYEIPYTLKDRPVIIRHSDGPVMKFGELYLDIENDLPYHDQIVDRWWQVVLKLVELGAFKIAEKSPEGCAVEVLQPRFDELYMQYEQTVQPLESPRQRMSSWDLPEETKWENITLRFLNGEEVILEVHGKTRQTICGEMGFLNQKTKRPNAQWQLLRQLAQAGGEIHWDNVQKLLPNDQDVLKTRIKQLRKALKSYFSMIDGDPFYDYRKEKAYRIKMRLLPEQSDGAGKGSDDEEYLKSKNPVVYDPYENERG